jgi:hypothetical protein
MTEIRKSQIEISKGVFVTDVEKFMTVYNARCESISVLSEGVKTRIISVMKNE